MSGLTQSRPLWHMFAQGKPAALRSLIHQTYRPLSLAYSRNSRPTVAIQYFQLGNGQPDAFLVRTRGKRVGRDKSSLNPDLILHNGKIYPDAKSRTYFEALAVREGRVTLVGTYKLIAVIKSWPSQ